VPEKLTEPFGWRSPKLVFVNSMSDLFQAGVPNEYAEAVSRVMAAANWHTYQVLTKRAERLRELLSGRLQFAAELENIWWGVSVEDRKHGLPRVDELRRAPARVRFLSVEPLLEDLGEIDLSGISWVIVGGESGAGARPMKREWVVSIRRQCREQGVPFFFKQWGGVRKAKKGRLLDGRTYDEYPVRVVRPVPDRADCLAWAEEFGKRFQRVRESSVVPPGLESLFPLSQR
jgi:protein gp37